MTVLKSIQKYHKVPKGSNKPPTGSFGLSRSTLYIVWTDKATFLS